MSLPPLNPKSLAGKLREHALGYPQAAEEFPWGERAIKVKTKAFLFMRSSGDHLSFTVKLPDSAAEALEMPGVEPTGYGLGKHGWVTVKVDSGRDASVDSYAAWIDESYRAVAPKKLVAELEARGAQSRS